jgi:hypothetical protein
MASVFDNQGIKSNILELVDWGNELFESTEKA